jgi:hypothetical protein
MATWFLTLCPSALKPLAAHEDTAPTSTKYDVQSWLVRADQPQLAVWANECLSWEKGIEEQEQHLLVEAMPQCWVLQPPYLRIIDNVCQSLCTWWSAVR